MSQDNTQIYLKASAAQAKDRFPCITIGGQAVNYWSNRFLAAVPEMGNYLPFNTRDLDVVATYKDQVEAISEKIGFDYIDAEDRYSGDLAAFYDKESELSIQVLNGCFGVKNEQLEKHAVLIQSPHGTIRMADITSLLQGKLYNLDSPIRSEPGKKRDIKHVKQLILCHKGYFLERSQMLQEETISERDVINGLKRYLEVTRSRKAEAAEEIEPFAWDEAIPEKELKQSQWPKLEAFIQNEISQDGSSRSPRIEG